jgi:glycosyltransferase involved in cell wall biosynthesis
MMRRIGPEEEIVNNVFIHRVKAMRVNFPDLTYPLEYPEKILKNVDIVHGHTQGSLFVVKMIEKAKEIGVKTFMYFMAIDALYDHPNLLVRSLGPFYSRWILKKAIQLSDVKLVRSLRDQDLLYNKYGVNAMYIPDGVSRWFVSHEFSGEKFREYYKLNNDYLIYIGRLHPLKGIDILIKALYLILRNSSLNLDLVIIGPGDAGPYINLAKRLGVDRNILFLGFVDEEVKIGAIDGSLAVIVPSISDYVEVYPMVISEAWARNKPIIATKVGGVPYRVKHMFNGLLVPPKDPKALAEAITLLANDKELGIKLGAEGRKSVMTWDEIAFRMLEIYKEKSS